MNVIPATENFDARRKDVKQARVEANRLMKLAILGVFFIFGGMAVLHFNILGAGVAVSGMFMLLGGLRSTISRDLKRTVYRQDHPSHLEDIFTADQLLAVQRGAAIACEVYSGMPDDDAFAIASACSRLSLAAKEVAEILQKREALVADHLGYTGKKAVWRV